MYNCSNTLSMKPSTLFKIIYFVKTDRGGRDFKLIITLLNKVHFNMKQQRWGGNGIPPAPYFHNICSQVEFGGWSGVVKGTQPIV